MNNIDFSKLKQKKKSIDLSISKTRFTSHDFNVRDKSELSNRTIREGLKSTRSTKSNNMDLNTNHLNLKESVVNKKNSVLNLLNTYKLKRESKVFMANFRFHNNHNKKKDNNKQVVDPSNKDKKYADFLSKIKEKANKRYKIIESGSLKDEAEIPISNFKKLSNELKDISDKRLKNLFQFEEDVNDLESIRFDVFSFEKITNRMKKMILSNGNCKK